MSAVKINMVKQKGSTPLKIADIGMFRSFTMAPTTNRFIPTGGVMYYYNLISLVSPRRDDLIS